MPIVKKAPGIMTREVKLEEPVNEVLEDYARFIESNPDHVLNAVLKKVVKTKVECVVLTLCTLFPQVPVQQPQTGKALRS